MTALAKNKINSLARVLKNKSSVSFKYNGSFYEIFKSADSRYIVNLYSSNEEDDKGELIEANLIDGGLCESLNERDAIKFML